MDECAGARDQRRRSPRLGALAFVTTGTWRLSRPSRCILGSWRCRSSATARTGQAALMGFGQIVPRPAARAGAAAGSFLVLVIVAAVASAGRSTRHWSFGLYGASAAIALLVMVGVARPALGSPSWVRARAAIRPTHAGPWLREALALLSGAVSSTARPASSCWACSTRLSRQACTPSPSARAQLIAFPLARRQCRARPDGRPAVGRASRR